MWRLWVFLSWQDIKQKYRGSVIGPFWVAGSLLALTLGAGALYAVILQVPYREYLPYLILSLTVWTLIASSIQEGCAAFLSAAPVIKNTPLPISLQIFRVVTRNLMVMAHNLVVVALVFAALGRPLATTSPLALLGLAILSLNLWWMAWVSAALSARYRDIGQIITYVMQFLLFVTPIFWMPNMVGRGHIVLEYNPLWHLIEIVRSPVLGEPIRAANWIVSGFMAAVGLAVAYFGQRRYRNEVVHWI
jgi:lipopolysaccharide transport system permease protein